MASLAALAVLGCASRGVVDRDQGSDAGGDVIEGGGTNPCGCSVELYAGALGVSWDCFCQGRDCSRRLPPGSACDGESSRVDYPGCGLTIISTPGVGGAVDLHVFDASGQLVGEQLSSDTPDFTCPSDPSFLSTGGSNRLRSGRFPDGTCAAVACPQHDCGPCTSDEGGPADAGDWTSPDCFIDPTLGLGGAVVMSWDRFCQGHDCSERLPSGAACNNARRDDFPGCGLTVMTSGFVIAGPTFSVFDLASGKLVGKQLSSDIPEFTCSSASTFPSNGAFGLRAGRFPDTTCASVSCVSDYCGPCPGP
jgi:hypothetical protein